VLHNFLIRENDARYDVTGRHQFKILIGFYGKYVYKTECLNKMFISISAWMIPIDNDTS